jgi:hypothetical protein
MSGATQLKTSPSQVETGRKWRQSSVLWFECDRCRGLAINIRVRYWGRKISPKKHPFSAVRIMVRMVSSIRVSGGQSCKVFV